MVWATLTSRRQKTKPRLPEGHRIYAVGDVHGRADLLLELLGRIDADRQANPISLPIQVFLGDYIDRGPQSNEVLELLIQRKKEPQTIYLKGNHEACVAEILSHSTSLSEWQQMGGVPTLLSYGVRPSTRSDPSVEEHIAATFRCAFPLSHHQFIEGLALSFSCGDYFFAHAGVRPGVPLQLQTQQDLLWIRDDFLLHEEDFGKVVVHGHTPVNGPDVRPNRINIDTGAYATGRLTCLVLEGDELRFL